MKAVMISIQPKWVELIANGQKTIEVRKTRPKIDTPFKCYIYETKCYDTLFGKGNPKKLWISGGKVIGEFVCDRITDISVSVRNCNEDYNHVYHNDECKGSCLTWKELQEYGKGKPLYAWHISDLVIYDEPKELWEFKTFCKSYYEGDNCDDCKYFIDCRGYEYDESDCGCNGLKPIERPFQSWGYVEEKE